MIKNKMIIRGIEKSGKFKSESVNMPSAQTIPIQTRGFFL